MVKILFTNVDQTVIRTEIDLSEYRHQPRFLQFRGKLYEHSGSGTSAQFYHQIQSFASVESDHDFGRLEFHRLQKQDLQAA
jgi:hypothetical protein